ncbi:hypothetical protein Q8F55_008798 [Vanrija albida]|uniref:RRM domain-containing protein n=1 Tax=Vanrija albida TaxID=181172 RepID=A0ABR3PRU7_9TREE
MAQRGRSTSPKPLTPSPRREDGDVSMSPPRNSNGPGRGAASGNGAPNFRVIVVSGLSKNVHNGHLEEIFGEYGKVTGLDLPVFKVSGLNRGKAAIEFERASSAEEAVRCMDGGILDGSALKVQVNLGASPPGCSPPNAASSCSLATPSSFAILFAIAISSQAITVSSPSPLAITSSPRWWRRLLIIPPASLALSSP